MKNQPTKSAEPRVIKNKDILLLSRVLYIMQDVCSLEKRIVWQNDRMYGVTAHITGMPGGKGVPSGFDAAFAAISGLNEEHKAQMQTYVRELKAAERIINSIPSRTMRTFVVMLYVDDLPATVVRRELNMTEKPLSKRATWKASYGANGTSLKKIPDFLQNHLIHDP